MAGEGVKRGPGRPRLDAPTLVAPTREELVAFVAAQGWKAPASELARMTGVHRSTSGRWLSGEGPVPAYVRILMNALAVQATNNAPAEKPATEKPAARKSKKG